MPEAWAPTAVGAVDGTTCVTLKIQGARTCTRADGYGCIRCSLYRALGLTGLIRLHMPRTACSMYACICTVHYSRSSKIHSLLTNSVNSITFTLAQGTAGYSVHDRSLLRLTTNTSSIKVTHLNALTIMKVPRGSRLLPW